MHTLVLADLPTCIFVYLHTFILAYLCKLACVHTCILILGPLKFWDCFYIWGCPHFCGMSLIFVLSSFLRSLLFQVVCLLGDIFSSLNVLWRCKKKWHPRRGVCASIIYSQLFTILKFSIFGSQESPPSAPAPSAPPPFGHRPNYLFLGCVNDLHTWQFPADRLTDLDKIKSSDWSKVGMLYRRGGHWGWWVWQGGHMLQQENKIKREGWAELCHTWTLFCWYTWVHTTSCMGSMFILYHLKAYEIQIQSF